MSALPGPSMHPIRQALKLAADPYGFLEELRAAHGEVFTLRLPGDPLRVVVCDPAHVKQVFALAADDYSSRGQGIHINLGSNTVLFSDGEKHRRQRALLHPPVHGARLKSYAQTMLEITARHVRAWRPGVAFALHPTMQAITLDVILQCVFGVDPEDERGARIRRATIGWLDAVFAPKWFAVAMAITGNRLRRMLDVATQRSRARTRRRIVPVPWAPIADHKAELLALLSADIAECRARGTAGREDVLALLVDGRDENGDAMGDEEILDQLVTMLTGGHETTATTLCWTFHHLLAHPEVLERLREELSRAFGDGPVDPVRCAELPWLEACIDEAMRLTPIAIAVTRTLLVDQRFGDHVVKAGTVVWPCTYLAHRRDETWKSPATFDPSRFLDASTPRPERYFPYGGGRRRCLGAAFAQFEMRIVLATIVHRCRLRAAAGPPPKGIFRGITIAPSNGVPVVLADESPSAGMSRSRQDPRTQGR